MKALTVAAILAGWLIGGDGQAISSDDIAAAIEMGRSGKTLQKSCLARRDNGMDIVVEGPIGRIMRAARDAKKKNREFSAADVTPGMAGAWLTVTASRVEAFRRPVTEPVPHGAPGPISYHSEFVIQSRPPGSERAIVLRPLGPIAYNSENSPSQRVVISGGPSASALSRLPLPGSDMEASFDLAAFKAIPHRDVEVSVFMTDTGGQKCRISEKERKALR